MLGDARYYWRRKEIKLVFIGGENRMLVTAVWGCIVDVQTGLDVIITGISYRNKINGMLV
jgi:hypothetical protein